MRNHFALTIALFLFIFSHALHAQVTITVDGNKAYQRIEGFGATTISLVYGSRDNLTPSLRAQAIDALYNQVKLTMGNTSLGITETPANATDTWNQRANDDNDPFNFNPNGFNWSGSDAMKQKLIDPGKQFGFDNFYPANSINVRWEMPWLKTIRGTDYNRFLDECAEHVAAGLIRWRDAYGIVQPYMMLFNEPTSGNGELDGGTTQMIIDIIKRCGSRLRNEGFASVRFVVPGEETEQRSLDVAKAILADQIARQYVGAIAYHPYPYGSTYASVPNILSTSGAGKPDAGKIAVRNALRDLGEKYSLPVWMTEVSHGEVDPRTMDALRGRAIHIHDEFVYANASAFFGMNNMWDMTAQQDHFGNKDLFSEDGTIVLIDDDAAKVYITGMGYAIGHYARWFRKGAKRIDATSDDPLVLVTAFRDDSLRRMTLVAINNHSADIPLTINLNNILLNGNLSGEQSYSTVRWQPLQQITPDSKTKFFVTLPALSVTSITVQIDEATEIISAHEPDGFLLEQNYPNPFNPRTMIRYQLPDATHAVLKVYDVLMREIVTLVDEEKLAGKHSVQFDATNLPSGVYFYRLDAGKFSQTRMMMMMTK